MPTIVLCGGGTAGHVMPNIALLPELKKHFDKIFYLGGDGIERKLAEKASIPFFGTPVIKFDRKRFFDNVKIPIILSKGIEKAKKIFEEIRPNIVFSKGGYAALPACFAAKKMGIPVVCHESDYSFGLANKLVKRFASVVLTSFPETPGGIYVGNPIREEILFSKNDKISLPGLDRTRKTILITGGSLGSVALNEIVYAALPDLLKKYQIIHISGKNGDFSVKKDHYFQLEYSDEFPAILSYADLVICRSGSNTLTEVAANGKRCITIPLPKGVSRGDQVQNAESFEKRGYCKVIRQEELSTDRLLMTIEGMWYKNPPILDVTKINETVVKYILSAL